MRNWGGLLLVIAILLLLFSQLPLGTALEFGGDEGYELMKGLLCSKGYSLYTQIWDDQPPVFTLLLSNAFKVCGPTILVARLIAVGFALVMFGAFYQLVRQRLGHWPALLAAFFLLAAPTVLLVSVSVMLEVPAIGMALASAVLLFQWCQRRHWSWLMLSGAVMGVALGIKFTAVMVVPAILVEIALSQHAPRRWLSLRATLINALTWAATAACVFILIELVWGKGSYPLFWKSHLTATVVPGLSSPAEHRFEPSLILHHWECVVAAALGVGLVIWQRRWRELAFPMVLLLTAVVVHAIHRPWWNYYYLHLAVPLAWLAGFGAMEAIRAALKLISIGRSRFASSFMWKGIALSALTALALALTEARLEVSIKALRQSPRADASPVLAKMRQHAERTSWVYAQPVIYPFHAGIAVPPELAVVMLKRFWSGEITTKEIVEICRRYRPEQLLLFSTRAGGEWKDLLEADYVMAHEGNGIVLYLAKHP